MVERIAHYTILERVGADGIRGVRARIPRQAPCQSACGANRGRRSRGLCTRRARCRQLSHPGVAIIYDVGDTDGQPFIASVRQGQTLRAVVGGHPLHPRRAVVRRADRRALADIDAAGVGYDTLTLESVMVTTRGNVKLLDVRIARWSGLGAAAGSNDAGARSRAGHDESTVRRPCTRGACSSRC
jgi:hypothetical protein